MKVACLIDSMSRKAGGVHVSLQRMTQELAARGDECRIFALRDEFTEADLPGWDPVPVSLSRPLGPRRFGFAWGIGRHLHEFAPDLVQTHGLWTYTSQVSGRWQRKTGRPCFIHPHGMLDPWAVRHSGWKKRIAAALFEDRHLQEAGCIRALCRDEADAVRAYGIRVPIAIIPNGIDLPAEGPEIAKTGPKILLYLGRLHPKKGLMPLVKAWAERGSPDWHLVIGGWDEKGHEADLRHCCDQLHLAHQSIDIASLIQSGESILTKTHARVSFLGPVFGQEKDSLLRRADAFILPSLSEGLPMTVLEAWAYRLPVVMTDPCNLPEGFAAGAALRIEPETNQIAEGLEVLFAMGERERRAMGEAGRALVEERFLWPSLATRIADVHEWLVGGGARPESVE